MHTHVEIMLTQYNINLLLVYSSLVVLHSYLDQYNYYLSDMHFGVHLNCIRIAVAVAAVAVTILLASGFYSPRFVCCATTLLDL